MEGVYPNVVPGDVVDVQTFKKRSYYEGKAVHFHELHSTVEPVCEHFAFVVVVNGKYELQSQLVFKQNEENHLRIGKIEIPEFEDIGSEKFFYRNKMEFLFEQPMVDRKKLKVPKILETEMH
jgi:23S rRNA (uracil1939-C5)-methyltransferase